MRINYNVSAMLSNNALANNDSLLAQSLQRLSSGLKINQAKDNPAGLAMAKRMDAQLAGLAVANQNAGDGVSVIEIADGAMTEISEMLQRMNELAIKAANGPLSDKDRATIQEEITQLQDEITRISETTEFNGMRLLDGSFDMKGYTNNLDIKVNGYSTTTPAKEYTITSLTITAPPAWTPPAPGEPEEEITSNEAAIIDRGYEIDLDNVQLGPEFPVGTRTSIRDNIVTFKADPGFELRLDISGLDLQEGDTVTFDAANAGELKIDVTGIGAMRLQIGANEGQILAVDIPGITLKNMGIEEVDVSTKRGALDTIARVDEAISYVSRVRGKLGAYQNQLESTINNLDVIYENLTGAYSRIMDVDMAEEMTNYATYQVLTQAGTSMLAQANERPAQVLQLLQ